MTLQLVEMYSFVGIVSHNWSFSLSLSLSLSLLLSLLKMGYSRPLFLYFRLFNTVHSTQMFNLKFAIDWIRTVDLWCRK